MRYLLAGGGTAGHVNPMLAVADRIREREPDAAVFILGTAEGLEARLVPARGYELLTVARLPFPRRPDARLFRFPARMMALIRDVSALLEEHGIDVVVGFGGYVSAPAYLAAWRKHVPFALHEANARPGMANRLGSLLTRFVGVAFAGTRLRNARVVGMPLRKELESLDRPALRAEAMEFFGLDPRRPVLLVTGGSLGSRSMNRTTAQSAAMILGAGWQLLHITGARAESAQSELVGYRTVAYCDRMDLAFSVAELAIARAGSATVSELTALGIPAVYVPLPIGNGEQRLNARGVVSAGGAIMVEDERFTAAWVSDELVPLLQDGAEIARMAARTLKLSVRDGTDRTVQLVAQAARSTAGEQG